MDDPVYFAGVYFPIASKQLQENNCAGSQRSTGGGGRWGEGEVYIGDFASKPLNSIMLNVK